MVRSVEASIVWQNGSGAARRSQSGDSDGGRETTKGKLKVESGGGNLNVNSRVFRQPSRLPSTSSVSQHATVRVSRDVRDFA